MTMGKVVNMTRVKAQVDKLAQNYWAIARDLQDRPGRRKKVTRAHKEAHTRQLDLLKAITELRPSQDPVAVVMEQRPSDIKGYE